MGPVSTGTASLAKFAAAVPLAACQAYGLGPFPRASSNAPTRRLASLRASREGVVTAADSAGRTGQQLLSLLVFGRGVISSEALAQETRSADPLELAAAVERLADAGLATGDGKGGLRLSDTLEGVLAPIGRSLADQSAITSDALEQMCLQVVGAKL